MHILDDHGPCECINHTSPYPAHEALRLPEPSDVNAYSRWAAVALDADEPYVPDDMNDIWDTKRPRLAPITPQPVLAQATLAVSVVTTPGILGNPLTYMEELRLRGAPQLEQIIDVLILAYRTGTPLWVTDGTGGEVPGQVYHDFKLYFRASAFPDDGALMKKVKMALSLDAFLPFTALLADFTHTVALKVSWIETCFCHEALIKSTAYSRKARLRAMDDFWKGGTCPWMGRRLPDFAMGKWPKMCDDIRSSQSPALKKCLLT